jgi:phenylpropionate dioxygenase-like ring-hydroxylating dioxygenase large terminal subunit
MQQATRRALVARIREYIDSGTTAMAPQVFRNPLKAYASPERLAQEQSTLFRDFPLLLGLSCDLRNPGDFLTDDYSGVPLLLVRQADGALLGMPGAAGFEGVDRDACALQRVAVEEKYGMVWAVPNPVLARQPVDIDRHLGALAAEYDSYGFAGYHHFATKVLEPRINWKMGIDGFLESYHLRVLHPETDGPVDVRAGTRGQRQRRPALEQQSPPGSGDRRGRRPGPGRAHPARLRQRHLAGPDLWS